MAKMKLKYTEYLDFLIVPVVWLLIFGKNAFSNLVLLDYAPSTFFDITKIIYMNDFKYSSYIFDFLKFIFLAVGINQLLFSISILIAMIISYHYIKRLSKLKNLPVSFTLLSALLFFFNPFIYSRIMVGQIGVIISYLLMPVCIFYIIKLFQSQFEIKNIIKAVISITIASSFSIHFIALNVIVFLTASFWFYFYRQKSSINPYFKGIVILFILLILLNAIWLQGLFSNSSIFSVIDSSHESFFAPKLSQDIPAVAKVMGMWGFWREGGYITSYRSMPIPLWYISAIILVALMLIGYYSTNKDKTSKFFFSLWWIGLILATGISHPYTSPIFDFLFKNLPLFNGFRDSHKFVSFIALSYAYLIPLGLINIKQKIRNKPIVASAFVFLALFIIAYTFPLISLSNQVVSVGYPDSYIKVNEYLKTQPENNYAIYLPWQGYLTYDWSLKTSSDGRISVPINQIVERNVIQGEDGLGSGNALTRKIVQCLDSQNTKCLENAGVRYVLKDKCAFYPGSYEWLNSTKAYETKCLDVYQLDNKQVNISKKIPGRFVFGLIISLVTFAGMVLVLARKSSKKPWQQ